MIVKYLKNKEIKKNLFNKIYWYFVYEYIQ